jgi:hypothetical protein
MVAMPGREFVVARALSAESWGVVAVQGMWMGRATLHWYAMIGMWLGRVTLFGYSSALGVVSTAKIAVPFVLLFLFMSRAYFAYIWHAIIGTIIAPKETLYGLMVGPLLAPSWGP